MFGVFDGGVTVFIRAGVVEIDTEPECCPDSFQQALTLVGASGRTDYQISYNPETGVETYQFPIISATVDLPVVDPPPKERVPLIYRVYEATAWTEQYVQEIGMRHTVRLVSLALQAVGHGV